MYVYFRWHSWWQFKVSKWNVFFSFPQFVSILFTRVSPGTVLQRTRRYLAWAAYNVAMHHIHDVTKPLMTLLLHYDVTYGPWLLRRCFKRGFGDHRKQRIYEFNWVVISIEMQLIKTSNRLAEIITLFVCKYSFKQQSLFKSNLARLNDGGSSPSVGVTNSCEVIEIIFFHSVLRKNRNDGTFIISFPSAFNNKVIFHSDGCVFLVRPKQDVSFLWSHDLSRDWQKVDRNGHAFRRDWMG